MGIGALVSHLGIVPGMIEAAATGKDIGEGALKGLQGTLDAAEVMAGVMTSNPQLIAGGTKQFVDDVEHDNKFSAKSVNQLMAGASSYAGASKPMVVM